MHLLKAVILTVGRNGTALSKIQLHVNAANFQLHSLCLENESQSDLQICAE
jgi:hypothetical protein